MATHVVSMGAKPNLYCAILIVELYFRSFSRGQWISAGVGILKATVTNGRHEWPTRKKSFRVEARRL